MPINLYDRATTQLALFEDVAETIRTRLGEARAERDLRHPDPSTVAQADWHDQLGAAQHLQVARAALAANRAAEEEARAGLAAVTTPADAGPQGDGLRDLLVEGAALRVERRGAEQRVAAAESLITALGALVAEGDGAVSSAEDRVAWAEEHQELGDRLRTALGDPPLDTIVTDAGDVLSSGAFPPAQTRLGELLPAELQARATDRFDEARAATADAAGHLAIAEDAVADRATAAGPIAAAVHLAAAELTAAESATEAYVGRSAGRLAAAVAALEAIAGHPDLTDAQGDATDAANQTDGVTAVGDESDLAAAVAAVAAAQRDVDDAILAALANDPDADPEADAAVIAARDALNAAGLQDPLTDARAAYDAAAQLTLDRWEVEVPPSLWAATLDFVGAQRTLEELSDQAARDATLAALDDATDALGAALDARDVAERADLHVRRLHAERAAVALAVEETAAGRLAHYTRGDGPSGRIADDL